jgi:hypothetical protein
MSKMLLKSLKSGSSFLVGSNKKELNELGLLSQYNSPIAKMSEMNAEEYNAAANRVLDMQSTDRIMTSLGMPNLDKPDKGGDEEPKQGPPERKPLIIKKW